MWEKRQIGRTSLQVTTLGLGTATMGGSRIRITQAEGEALVTAAWDAGVRYVDTAPFYGMGAAEHRVGNALRDKDRDEWVLSSKVGRLLRPKTDNAPSPGGRLSPMPFKVAYDYGYDGIMRSVEDSYQRLGLARIDIRTCTISGSISTASNRMRFTFSNCGTVGTERWRNFGGRGLSVLWGSG